MGGRRADGARRDEILFALRPLLASFLQEDAFRGIPISRKPSHGRLAAGGGRSSRSGALLVGGGTRASPRGRRRLASILRAGNFLSSKLWRSCDPMAGRDRATRLL
jgi:hypothetical protein